MKVMIVEETLHKVPEVELLIPEHNLIWAGDLRYKVIQYPTVTILERPNIAGDWVTTHHYGKLYVRSEIGIDLFVYEHKYSKAPILDHILVKSRNMFDIYFTKRGPHLLLIVESDSLEERKTYIVVNEDSRLVMFTNLCIAIGINNYTTMFGTQLYDNTVTLTDGSKEYTLNDYVKDRQAGPTLVIERVKGPDFDLFSRSPVIDLIEGKFIEVTERLEYHDLTQTVKN